MEKEWYIEKHRGMKKWKIFRKHFGCTERRSKGLDGKGE